MTEKETVLYSHLHVHAASQRHNDKDTRRKTQEDSLQLYLPLTLLQGSEGVVQGFACEHKLHILTTVMTVTLCLSCSLNVGVHSIGRVWPSLPHLVSTVWNSAGNCFWHPTQLNYIIIQCPHDRPLDP